MAEKIISGGVAAKNGTSSANFAQLTTPEIQPEQFTFDTKAVHSIVSATMDTNSNGFAGVRAVTAISEPNGAFSLQVNSMGAPLTMSTPTNVDVGNASEALVAANSSRRYLSIVNLDGADTVFLAFGDTALANKGVTLLPNTAYEMSAAAGNLTTAAVNAIASGASAIVAIQEGT